MDADTSFIKPLVRVLRRPPAAVFSNAVSRTAERLCAPLWFILVAATLCGAGALDGVPPVHDSIETLARSSPVIVILDTEHPDRIKEEQQGKKPDQYKCRLFKAKVEQITGLRCLVLHYTEALPKEMARPNIKALLISARRKQISKDIDDEFFALIRDTTIPTMGFCGGHQLIAQAFGGKVAPMRPLRPDETDPNPDYWPGIFKEWGFTKVRVLKRDPILAGLPDDIVVRELHAWEITDLPPEFDILAATQECKIQMIKHKSRPLYGSQFHAELYDDKHPHGKVILQNFFRIAGIRIPR